MKTSLILVPGLLCDEAVWAHQSAALAGLADVHIATNGARDTLVAMAEAIIAQAPARFALAGHSMGGRVALEVVRRVPERVVALALLDTGHMPLASGDAGEREVAGRMALVEKARREGMRAMGRDWMQGMVHPTHLADADLVNAILDMIERRSPELYAAQTRALIGRPDATPVLTSVRCPTLVLCGREDAWSPPRRHEDIRDLVPGSRLTVVAECGHMSTMEQPGAVSQALHEWLERAIEHNTNLRHITGGKS
ncbi:MAG: Alpha/beta hydrolase family [Gammaproteobacteria bacterium]|nr:Alpha/beta hydrolase family [Gammaproteobacteria bacterium]